MRSRLCAIALLTALSPAVGRAQHIQHAASGDSTRYHIGVMATGLLTSANPSLRYNVPSKRYALLEFARTDESLGSQRVFRPEGQRLLDLFRTANGHVDFQIVGITSWSIGTVQFAAPATRVPGLPRTRFTPFVEVARASARAQRTPAVFVPADFYGSNTQWLLSLGARVHAGSIRWRMGRYVRSASAGPSAFTSSHTHL